MCTLTTTWTLVALLGAAAVGHAESLAEIAARTKAARDKAQPVEKSAPAKQYGQEDLERVAADPARGASEPASSAPADAGADWAASGSESAPPPASVSPDMGQLETKIRHWRDRCQQLKGTVEYRRRSLADLEAYEERALERRPRGERRSDLKEQLDAEVAEARTSLARAEEALSACEDEARRDGVSPSQLE